MIELAHSTKWRFAKSPSHVWRAAARVGDALARAARTAPGPTQLTNLSCVTALPALLYACSLASWVPPAVCVSRGSRNLAFLSVGLGSLGLICLLVAMVGSYAPTKTMMMQELRFAHKPPQQAVGRQLEFNAKLGREAERKVRAAPKKGTKKANGQQLKLTFAGDTPLGDDDFDAAGYNMEGVWDWKLGRFRSPKFEHEPVIDAFEDPETGDHLEVPGCEPDDSLPKAILYDDCGSWPRWEWNYEKQCWRSWWGWYYGCWRHTYVPMEMPDGGSHELPMGFYSRLGAECYDDR